MKYLIFGTGEYYGRYKKWFDGEYIVALLDNSPEKQNRILDGKKIVAPEEGVKLPHDAVVILSFHVKAMKKQLMDLGVEEQDIYHFYDLRKLIDVKKCRKELLLYGISREELSAGGKKKIALLSTDLALGGTAIALYHLAEAVKKNGYGVVFASMVDGPLKEKLRTCGIPVIIDPNLQIATMQETEWVKNYGLIVCNAINYYLFLTKRDSAVPTIWWLHDSLFFYDGIDKAALKGILAENLHVLSVGPVPEAAIKTYVPDMPVGQLLYGVKDTVRENEDAADENLTACKNETEENSGKDKVCFVTIGHIEERKGQDILLQAVSLLEKGIREKAEIYLVGPDTSLMAHKLRKEAAGMPEIHITGAVDRGGIERILQKADMLLCPSREDPMPTVAAEAMMHSVPCLVSDAVGTAAYITRGENGDIFESGNIRELAEKIRWHINHRDRLKKMGENARRVYDQVFSMVTFERELMKKIRELL